MDFLVCKCVLSDLHTHRAIEGIKDEDEAVSKAQEIAIRMKEGATVGLFTREGDVVCGWKVGKDGGLRSLLVEQVEDTCGVGPGDFDLAKREAAKLRKAREDKLR